MATFDIPQLIPKPSEKASPIFGPRTGYQPNFREISASKKVDDISRHESRHDMAPKHDPKPNAREKPEPNKPQGGKPLPGTERK